MALTSPPWFDWSVGVWAMKLVHLCYVAIGFAIARWVFNRHAIKVVDPVARYRTSGLL
jgi:hypothetical protein